MPKSYEQLNADIFKDMKRDGCSATADQQRQAFVKWKSSEFPDRYSGMAARLNQINPAPAEVLYPYHRCADAVLQKLRKADLLIVCAAKWSLTERGKCFHAHVAENL